MREHIIRTAVATDASGLAQIYIDSWNQGFGSLMPTCAMTPELVMRWGRDLTASLPQQWWVSEISNTIVGFVGIGPSRDPLDPKLGELETIAVDPAW